MASIPSFPLAQQHAPATVPINGDAETTTIDTPILIVGGGPVGLLLAYVLSHRYAQPCTLIEASPTTTTYPKMEFTNGRSMELYRQLGLVQQLRDLGVPEHYTLDEIFTTGLANRPGCKTVLRWYRESPEVLKRKDRETNDGTAAVEPYLRCSQIHVEKWLKDLVAKENLAQSYFGWRFVGLKETAEGVVSEVVAADGSGKKMQIRSQYLVGCDGGGSLVRNEIGIKSDRKDLNVNMMFVHLRSRDPAFTSQGRFWHCLSLSGAGLVAQDEKDTYTWHMMVPDEVANNPAALDAEKAVREGIGGLTGEADVEIDEIIVTGVWRSKVAVADAFTSKGGRVFLAGDSAHQLSPVGGHGLNSGLGDVWDLGWKLSAVLKGWGNESLLPTYDFERRSVSLFNLEMVEKATKELLMPLVMTGMGPDRALLTEVSDEGDRKRDEVSQMLGKAYWVHHQDGTTLGRRYEKSPIVVHEYLNGHEEEEEWEVQHYKPSTMPGGRPPHVWLKDRQTSVFDLLSGAFNVVDFTEDGQVASTFGKAAKGLGVPLKIIHLPDEAHVRKLWQRDAVLVRPDGFVGWRLPARMVQKGTVEEQEARNVLKVLSGHGQ